MRVTPELQQPGRPGKVNEPERALGVPTVALKEFQGAPQEGRVQDCPGVKSHGQEQEERDSMPNLITDQLDGQGLGIPQPVCTSISSAVRWGKDYLDDHFMRRLVRCQSLGCLTPVPAS